MLIEFTVETSVVLKPGVRCAVSVNEATGEAGVWTEGFPIKLTAAPAGGAVAASDPAAVVANLTSPSVIGAIEAVTGIKVSALTGLFGPLLPFLKGLNPANLGKTEAGVLESGIKSFTNTLKAVNPTEEEQ